MFCSCRPHACPRLAVGGHCVHSRRQNSGPPWVVYKARSRAREGRLYPWPLPATPAWFPLTSFCWTRPRPHSRCGCSQVRWSGRSACRFPFLGACPTPCTSLLPVPPVSARSCLLPCTPDWDGMPRCVPGRRTPGGKCKTTASRHQKHFRGTMRWTTARPTTAVQRCPRSLSQKQLWLAAQLQWCALRTPPVRSHRCSSRCNTSRRCGVFPRTQGFSPGLRPSENPVGTVSVPTPESPAPAATSSSSPQATHLSSVVYIQF